MNTLKRNNSKYPMFLIFYLFIPVLILGACAQNEQVKQKVPAKHGKTNSLVTNASEDKWKLPISIPEGEFSKLAGWLSEKQILYITNLEQTSSIYRYELFTGKSELIYKSEYPIINVQISPSRKSILIHASKTNAEGLVTIIDTKGNVIFKKDFPSYELAFEWNPYNESRVLVTKFAEDWSFQVLLLDLEQSTTTELDVPQPFMKWIASNQIAWISWNVDQPSLFAPLNSRNLDTGMEKKLFSSVIHFSAFPDLTMTVTINEQDQSMSSYSFYDKDLRKLSTFSMPQLTKYSDWLVPFYDYNKEKGQFTTLRPLSSGESDAYSEGFQLLNYNIKNGRSELIMEGLENEPLILSPTGGALLYGNRFEKIIDLNHKKIYELIKE
ncbi:hypothetical protein COJ96_00890 [Bacillus sp. AFS073361]|uniref:YqgU-like beta propeller domain-containing protein n=1 Tax=Bacillus sp. AFS073361 TaxID=2033511 RepID=UPI000BF99958|nr:hypothetical protein [Bacillus sp. AFS073361]PFP31228.1 hypothetical protein COJ96_00890 [Bacillus sp. AFS073361]